MYKKIVSFIVLSILLFPTMVYATDRNSEVWSGSNVYTCTSKYQDNSLLTDKSTYFSHCMEVRCENYNPIITYYTNNKVTCTNGNTSPYFEVINNSACEKYNSRVCNNDEIRYCSMVVYYDCERTSSGAQYFTTTKKKTTTKRVTTKTTTKITTTTQRVVSNTKLASLTLSSGTINFSSDVYNYNIDVDSMVNTINVSAIPEDKTSTVDISGNTNVVDGSIIKITVTGTDGNKSEYRINVKKKVNEKLSNNAKLKSLTIKDYQINFNSNITNYTLIVDNGVEELDIKYEVEDEKAKVVVEGNSNISDGSVIKVTVTAEDGSTNIYTIDIKVKKKSNFIKILFIIILILSLLAGAYYIYKKFVASKSGDKYEYE